MPILSLVLSAAVGACAGYVTNDVALRLMFNGIQTKRRTWVEPFITKSKEELADSLGDLVQDKLMNAPAGQSESLLFDKLQQETFTPVLQACLTDFLSTALPKYLDTLEYAEIPGYATAVAQIQEQLQEIIERHAPDLLSSFTEPIPLANLLTVPQQQAIGQHLLDALAQTLTPGTLEDWCTSLIGGDTKTTAPSIVDASTVDTSDTASLPCIADIVGEAETAHLREALIQNGMAALITELRASPEKRQEWKAQIQSLLETANGTHALATALQQVAEQPLSQLLGSDTINEWVEHTLPLLRNLVQDEAFAHILLTLAEQIRAALCDLRVPLYHICPEPVRNQLSEYLSRRLPDAIPYFSQYLQSRRDAIEQMIEREVDAVIDENTSTWFWANGLRNWFRSEILEAIYAIDVVQKMENYVEEFLQSEDREAFCREQLTSLLEKNTVADVANRFLSADMLCGWLHKGCIAFLAHPPKTVYEKIGEIRLAALLDESSLSSLTQSAAQALTKEAAAVLVERVLCSETIDSETTVPETVGADTTSSNDTTPGSPSLQRQFQNLLQTQADRLLHTPLGQLVSADTLHALSLSQTLQKALYAHRDSLIERFRPTIEQKLIADSSVGSVLQEHIESLTHALSQGSASAWKRLTNSIAHSKLAATMQYWKQKLAGSKEKNANAFDKLTDWLQKHGVPPLVHRLSAKKLVVNKILGMPNAWIGAQMREFIGKELRPLCILGALFGVLIAVVWELAISPHITGIFPRAIAYASIGIITNWLAFFGLFRPYTPKTWLPKDGWVPGFSYIPKRIPQIAETFGEVISQHLLDADSIRAQLVHEKEPLCAYAADQLTQNNGAVFGKLLQEHRSQWVPALTETLQSRMQQNADELAGWLCRVLTEQHTIGQVLPSTLCDSAGESLAAWLSQQLTPEGSQALVAALQKADGTSSLYDWHLFTPEAVHQQVHRAVTLHLPSLCEQLLHFDTVRDMIEQQQQKRDNAAWRTKSLQDCLALLPSLRPEQADDPANSVDPVSPAQPASPIHVLAQKVSDWAVKQLFSPKASDALYAQLDRFLQQQFQPEDTIGTCLHGKLRQGLDHSFHSIIQTLLQWLLRYIQSRETEITQNVIQKVHESVNIVPRALIDADNLVQETISRLLQSDLPAFFQKETAYITDVGRQLLEREIYPIPLSDLQSDVARWELKPLLSYVLSSSTLRQRVQMATDTLCPVLLQEVLQQPLGTLAQWAQIENLTDLCDRFRPQLTLVLDELRTSIQNTPAVTAQTTSFLCAVLDQHILQRPFGELLAWCPSEALAAACLYTGQYLLQQPATSALLQTMVERLYTAHAEQPIAVLLNPEELQRSLCALLQQPTRFTEALQQVLRRIGQELESEPLRALPPETQHWVALTLLQALWDTLNGHMEDLLCAVDVRDITTQVIRSLDGRGVHEMFKGFASPYFNKLIRWGGIGIVFCAPGTPIGIVYVLLSGLYLWLGQPQKDKEK